MKDACVLFSSGIESSVLLWKTAQEREVYPVHVGNGFIWEDTEVEYGSRFIDSVETPNEIHSINRLEFPLDDVYPDHWSLSGEDIPSGESEEGHYLPGRNIVLLSKTALFCHFNGINDVVHGTLKENPFPDATDSFFGSYENGLSEGLDHEINVLRPFDDRKKTDVIRMAVENDLPLEHTFSCLRPVAGVHCGECKKCHGRRESFAEAGVDDPTEYADG
ncbi:MAG: 7-cyano-7-deazaguanine synthase [Halobacteria archaeon]|nr:7-cyano-7-deazaguanine synthase [Halobacteria archaeon]